MAQDNDKAMIEAALGNMLEPIVAMLLRNGVTYQEFASFSKNSFVAVAQRDFGVRGRPTNSSRISAMTGIDRREVKRIKDLLLQDSGAAGKVRESQDRLSRVVRAWYEDHDFLDNAKPKILSKDEGGDSFRELVKRYGGGLPYKAVLKELVNAGNVKIHGDESVEVIKPYYSPQGSNPEALLHAGTVINELSNTLLHNLYIASNNKRDLPRFERSVSSSDINVNDINAFKAFLNEEGHAFLERVTAWINHHQIETDDPTQTARLGVGVFGIECRS